METNNIKDKISEEEIKERRKLLREIDASNLLSGIEPPKEGEYAWELREEWVNGKITPDEMTELLCKHYGLEQ